MKALRMPVATLALCVVSAGALAAGGVSFSYKNWEVVCDNVLTCRAAGYGPEEGSGGSVLLTREAGPNSVVQGRVMLADIEENDSPETVDLALFINDQPLGNITPGPDGDWILAQQQTDAIIKAVTGSDVVEFRGGKAPFALSGDGANAVMLKMDDVQGRVNTVGALIKKGNKPESSVPVAPAIPAIVAAPTLDAPEKPLDAQQDSLIRPLLQAATRQDDCERLYPDPDNQPENITVTPLDEKHVLLSSLCWRAAYNEGYGYWVMDAALKGKPQLVTSSGTSYQKGIIDMAQKGRGLGDCWGNESWVWDGKAFQLSSSYTTGMCRYLRAGGTWVLPTWVTDVKKADNAL
ncbi:DUF1176 domain-containing protein [Atlantibacter hermannii]|uniref:DUF1176 domain-containing protein n=1 Tax=Atlantibacter hermannii TaxID=565 RepID=UPI0028AB8A91|nr:DUF1176 domain-containing protein [Atlantibacter hermannii]